MTIIVIHCTGQGSRASDETPYLGLHPDGSLHFPGIGVQAAGWLVKERVIVGIGIDTAGINSRANTQFPVHSDITLPHGVWRLAELVNVDQVLARGAIKFVGVIPFVGGSGVPARVFVVVLWRSPCTVDHSLTSKLLNAPRNAADPERADSRHGLTRLPQYDLSFTIFTPSNLRMD